MQQYHLVPAQTAEQADEWVKLGIESHVASNLPLAQQRYQQAMRLDPRHAGATNNLACVFAQSPGLLNEGLLTIERAEMLDGKNSTIRINRALMSLEADWIDQAIKSAQEAHALEQNVTTRFVLASILTTAGRASESVPLYNQILDEDPKHPAAGPNSCFAQTLTNATPTELLKQRQRWLSANGYTGAIAPHPNDMSANRPLRVGYVGGDFKCHSAAFIFSAVLWHHTPAIEMYLYSTLPVDPAADAKTKRFMDLAGDRWRDISAMNDEDADKLIRKDGIDILVDLAGHTNGGRLTLFTRKPSPVQATAWGFAHGTGLPQIDYFLADPVAVPESEREHYAEKIWDLPCIVTFEEPKDYNLKGTSIAPVKKNGFVTFGCYTRYEKLSDECLKTFADILKAVPDSRIEFKDHAFRRPYSLRRVQSFMEGIEPERLMFSIATNHSDHMISYQSCDVFLNPFWHSSGVVCMECLYMGVPIITLNGTQAAGRTGASVLTAMGRTQWIAQTPEHYVQIAVAMAQDPKPLNDVRKTLRDELLRSPVVVGYVAAVEAAYRGMFEKWTAL